ncbi:transcriptional regulator, ArsR family [Prauserella aidingensis]|uniref:ArsR/SmtB family transcription factor n=1 Tax=Prauserella aidingensis TaxID=387890 RepID=UPI0020A2403A|nr:winged helix-turn-helix domain-containing protein [Prauserella aidingensis]MCP2254882.1 transcriptional regulator, ArsR family [Prauserella aidingensis]MCP2255615.1 transcriptional regulator, ArsR family [Prauserella aidingensis]
MTDQGRVPSELPSRETTVREAKALGHPLRLRILRLCWQRELTNKQLAERVGRDPGTVLHHVRHLVQAGLLEQAAVRTGDKGALEKPYRAVPRGVWLDDPGRADPAGAAAPLAALQDELRAAGPGSVSTFFRFALHLSDADAAELHHRIQAVIDEYTATDDQRRDRPAYGGAIVVHRLAE